MILTFCAIMMLTGCTSLSDSFYNNLIAENRYKMILDGLQVTLVITFFATVLGTLLGGLVCWMRMSRRAWLRQVAKVYIDLMRGTPVLVLLMLMYYVVMAPLDTTGIVVAIVTFAMNTAAYISEMLRTTIQGIDRGQTEAGLALGFTPRQTFFKIVLPQVVRAVMPVYQGEVVSLLKGTSIVGYIAVADMTRASDLIRSRTFDAFFPLILTAVIYFLMAWLIGLLLQSLVERKRVKAAAAAVSLLIAGMLCYVPAMQTDDSSSAAAFSAAAPSAAVDSVASPSGMSPLFKALEGKRVAVILGSHQDLLITEKVPDAQVLHYTNMTDLVNAVMMDKADVVCTDDLLKLVDRKHAAQMGYVDAGEPPMPMAAMFKLGNTELQEDFNRFLSEIRADGTFQQIHDRWYEADDPAEVPVPQQKGSGDRVVRLATYSSYPPFSFISHGKHSGLSIELVTEWVNRRNWRLEILSMEVVSLVSALQTGKADIVAGGINITEERSKQVLFSDETCASHVGFFTKKGSHLFDGVTSKLAEGNNTVPSIFKSLKGKRVVVIIGTIQDIAITKMAPDANIMRVATITDMLATLENGKADVASDESLTLDFNKELASKVDTMGAGLETIPVGVVFRKDNTELQQDFNHFLAEIRSDSTYQRIYSQWQQAEDPEAIDIPQRRGTGRTLRVAINASMPPFSFFKNGELSGLEPALLTEWANRRNWKLEYLVMDFAALIPAVQAGKADVAVGDISITEERTKEVLFSDAYIESHTVLITRKGELGILTAQTDPVALLDEGESGWLWVGVALLAIIIGGGTWFFFRRRTTLQTNIPSGLEGQGVTVSHLSKRYGSFDVLHDITVDIHRGEVISIIGPSGTGKSTFLRCLNLLEQPSGGSIVVDGEDILTKGYPVNRLRQKMGMVFQSFNLFEHKTVLENVIFAPCQLLHQPEEEARREGLALLRKVGLAEKADVYPSSLSGGQKQRVAIARALAMKPSLILFDEPTSALDPTMVGEVLSVIRQLAQEGMTMLIVTHEMKFAHDVSTRIFFMYDGYIHEDGSPEQIFENPIHSATKAFIQRIRKEVFEIDGPDFDFLGMHSSISAFCHKYGIPEKEETAHRLTDWMLGGAMASYRPITVRITHSEQSLVTALDFMVEKMTATPLTDDHRRELSAQCREVIEEPTKRGFRVKLII